jgi:hypothetical protein
VEVEFEKFCLVDSNNWNKKKKTLLKVVFNKMVIICG